MVLILSNMKQICSRQSWMWKKTLQMWMVKREKLIMSEVSFCNNVSKNVYCSQASKRISLWEWFEIWRMWFIVYYLLCLYFYINFFLFKENRSLRQLWLFDYLFTSNDVFLQLINVLFAVCLPYSKRVLTLSHLQMHFDAIAADDF